MFRLALILHLFIGSTMAGSAIIAMLVTGQDTLYPIVIAAFAGFVLSIPLSVVIAKKLYES